MKRRLVALLVVLVSLGTAAGYWWLRAQPGAAAPAGPAVPPVAVAVAQAYLGPAVERLTLVGSLRARSELAITPPEAGHIVALPLAEGSLVREGDLLIALESSVEQANLADAEQRLKASQLELDRAADLAGKGFSSRAQFDTARVAVASAQSAVIGYRAKVEHRSLNAPFSGQIGRIKYSVGAYIAPGDVVTTLRAVDVMEVSFSIPENRVGEIRQGMPFTAVLAAGKDITATGRIGYISPVIDPVTRSAELVGRIPNPDGALKAGMFARVSLPLAVWENAVLVPENALVYALAGEHVYRLRDGKAERVPVTVGVIDNGLAEIRSGLVAGDLVVTDGRFQLRHGVPVATVPAKPALAASR